MILWLDAQLPPALAPWLASELNVEAQALRDLGLRDASDQVIFDRAREAGAVVLTKDSDFVELVGRLGPPPQIVWLTIGNTTKERLREVFAEHGSRLVKALRAGEDLIEIGKSR
ncbi:DUF5615 family PIN-like protein [Engelhardtia mirabilis]|uniref:DUF5615 domain-containing protein n=1 Tax=Engelhardtia mirabilis TaxID=2528011 RepID=A0A518BH87_9BACT|nr:hypothetical protein Pla133_14070 [Planctomycetes bacterium Pla133]QDV00663.1 hypothetical protein Pla86_14060 [Planctomycetes bacterium Pla86]